MELLDRDEPLSKLHYLLNKVTAGEGRIAAISGDAGIGKTSLVEAFAGQCEGKAEIFWGACDNLYTPRPFAPVYDMAHKMSDRMSELLDAGMSRPSIFSTFLNEINLTSPAIVVIEDVHWADESTLDLINFLTKRISRSGILLILTYRNDEIGSGHSLRLIFGSLSSRILKRIELTPLSKDAVMKLARSCGRNDDALYIKTGGNPFFVTEILLNVEKEIPSSINDLIVSRLNSLSSQTRDAIETLSVIPGTTDLWLIKTLVKDINVIDEAIESGILRNDFDALHFSHELFKTAIEGSLSPSKRFEKNSAVLNSLLKKKNKDPFLSRIIHHAVITSNKDVITKYAPLAAKQASKASAHERAAELYLTAIQFSDQLTPKELLDLLEERAHECYLTARIDEGIQACQRIGEILKQHKDPLREGENYRRMSRFLWYHGFDNECEMYLLKAINILEKSEPGNELAMVYSNLSQIYMLREKKDLALKWGEKALEISQGLKDREVEAHALNNIGTSRLFTNDESGRLQLKRSLEISLDYNLNEHVCRAYVNLGTVSMYRRDLSDADLQFSYAIEYANEKDISLADLCVTGEVAQTKLHMGKWNEAYDLSNTIYERKNVPVMDKILPLSIIGILKARRNEPGAFQFLDESNELMTNIGELMKVVKVKASRAEAFWLCNELESHLDEFLSAYEIVKDSQNPWAIGELAYWLWKGHGLSLSEIPQCIAQPFLLHIQGNWTEAAELWEKLGSPYEHALALSEGDEKAMKKAIAEFDELGAVASSQLLKRKMRMNGIKNIPKGPRQSTKENPFGLTERQIEILDLVSKGYSNSEIGNKLFISVRTVEAHVSTLFFKLDMHSRAEAASFVHSNQFIK